MISEGSSADRTFFVVKKGKGGTRRDAMGWDGPWTNDTGTRTNSGPRQAEDNSTRLKLAPPLPTGSSRKVKRGSSIPTGVLNKSVGPEKTLNKKLRVELPRGQRAGKVSLQNFASKLNTHNRYPHQVNEIPIVVSEMSKENRSSFPWEELLFCRDEDNSICWKMGDATPISKSSLHQYSTTTSTDPEKRSSSKASTIAEVNSIVHVPITPVQATRPSQVHSMQTTPSPGNPPIFTRAEISSPAHPHILPHSTPRYRSNRKADNIIISPAILRATTPPRTPSQKASTSTSSSLLELANASAVHGCVSTASHNSTSLTKESLTLMSLPPNNNDNRYSTPTTTTMKAKMADHKMGLTTPKKMEKKPMTLTAVENRQKQDGDEEEEFFCSFLESPPHHPATGLPLLQRAISLLDEMRITGDISHSQCMEVGEEEDVNSLFYGA